MTVEIPPALADAVVESDGPDALARWALEALVLEGVRRGLVTTGEAAHDLGLGYFEAEAFLKAHDAHPPLTDEDLAQDRADLAAASARIGRA